MVARVATEESSSEQIKTEVAPHFLSMEAGNRCLVFTDQPNTQPNMVLLDLETGSEKPLGPGFRPFYSPSGHLVYVAVQVLWAMPFSPATLTVTGEPFPIAQKASGATVATDQTLVYADTPGGGSEQLVWLDRRGNKTDAIGQPYEMIGWPALSPDGTLSAFASLEDADEDVWVYDIARETRTRLTSAKGRDMRPVWSPTSEYVGFTSGSAGGRDIYFRPADGSGAAQALLEEDDYVYLTDWSKDGQYVLINRSAGTTKRSQANLWYLSRDDGGDWTPHQLTQTRFTERSAKLSPDGRYVAYASDESGQWEVYVQPFPEGGRRATISTKGGRQPRWSRDGTELFYVEGATLMVVPVSTGPSFSPSRPERLFEHSSLSNTVSYPMYDVSPDGQRFVVAEPVGDPPEPYIQVVQNWHQEFRDHEQD